MKTLVTPEIIADIMLLATDKGGRKTAICQGEYRGILGIGTENFSFRWFIPREENSFMPGETRRLGIQFLVPDEALSYFPVGTRFTIWEGHIIGKGVVLKVLKDA